jgi:aspartokinase-like uncharacterized kinase
VTAGSNTGLSVVKIGGALTQVPAELDRVCRAVSSAAAHHRLLVVPGGGPFADAVRSVQVNLSLSNDAAHWMAILAMDQYALLLAERIDGSVLLDEPGAVAGTVIPGRAGIIAPFRWMRHADVLPHGWEVTSDSIAAFIAGAMDAVRLVLIKPSSTHSGVDSYFQAALPTHLPHYILGADRVDEIETVLSGSTAGAESG